MSIAKKSRIFLAKLQNLPDNKKKIILWTIVVVAALGMGFFWVRGTINNISKISGAMQNVKMPQIDMPSMPSLDILQTATPSNK